MAKRFDRQPRYRVGDWVATSFWPAPRLMQIIEYRGPLGADGQPMYRLRHVDEWGTTETEYPEGELTPVIPPPAVAQAAAARTVTPG